MTLLVSVVRSRLRLFASLLVGIVAWLLLTTLAPLTRGLVAWDIACVLYLALCAAHFARAAPAQMPADAERQQDGEWTIFWLTVAGLVASVAAIVGEFSASKDMPAAVRGGHVVLVAVTLLVCWLMTHVVFALRYAHEYYERPAGSAGKVAGGLDFPSDDEPDYWDFLYFSIVLGMTFQVSDVQITARSLRRLATVHGLMSFLFNTILVALTVNIGASLL